MDNFLRVPDEGKDQNRKTNSANAYVDKERIQRLKRSFLPFWMRELEEQKQNYNETSSTKRPSRANIQPK